MNCYLIYKFIKLGTYNKSPSNVYDVCACVCVCVCLCVCEIRLMQATQAKLHGLVAQISMALTLATLPYPSETNCIT